MTHGSVVRKPLIATLLVTGITVGTLATDSKKVIQAQWKGKAPQEAASYLLDVAIAQAGKGSWERIAWAHLLPLRRPFERTGDSRTVSWRQG